MNNGSLSMGYVFGKKTMVNSRRASFYKRIIKKKRLKAILKEIAKQENAKQRKRYKVGT